MAEAWPAPVTHITYVPPGPASAVPPLSPGQAYAASPTTAAPHSAVPTYYLAAPPTAAPLTGYSVDVAPATGSAVKPADESVVSVEPVSRKTWNHRLLPSFCAASSIIVAVALILATAAPTVVPSAVYSWQTVNMTTNTPLGIGITATVNLDQANKTLQARPLWETWAGAPPQPMQLWMGSHILVILTTAVTGLLIVLIRHPECDRSLRHLRFGLAFLLFPLLVPLGIACILTANVARSQAPPWHWQPGGLALDMGSLLFALLAIGLALRLDRDPLAGEIRREKDRFRLMLDMESQREDEQREVVRHQRKMAGELKRNPALAIMLLNRRKQASTTSL